jgi:AraC family transcriptional regulator
MEPRIEIIKAKKLIGKHLTMSLVENRTHELWKSFMPLRKIIKNNLSAELISMQVYDQSYSFKNFDPAKTFEKWAAVEVESFDNVLGEMETFTLPAGLYAVFLHRGAASAGAKTFQFIFGTWLPASEYELDNKPHFELLGEKYKNDDENSEEEIWIPIRLKN